MAFTDRPETNKGHRYCNWPEILVVTFRSQLRTKLFLCRMAIPASEALAGLHVELFHAEKIGHGWLHRLRHELHPLRFFFHQLLESRSRIRQFRKLWVRHFEKAVARASAVAGRALYILEHLRTEVVHDGLHLRQHDFLHIVPALALRHVIPVDYRIRGNDGVGDDEGVGSGKRAGWPGMGSKRGRAGKKRSDPKDGDGNKCGVHVD